MIMERIECLESYKIIITSKVMGYVLLEMQGAFPSESDAEEYAEKYISACKEKYDNMYDEVCNNISDLVREYILDYNTCDFSKYPPESLNELYYTMKKWRVSYLGLIRFKDTEYIVHPLGTE